MVRRARGSFGKYRNATNYRQIDDFINAPPGTFYGLYVTTKNVRTYVGDGVIVAGGIPVVSIVVTFYTRIRILWAGANNTRPMDTVNAYYIYIYMGVCMCAVRACVYYIYKHTHTRQSIDLQRYRVREQLISLNTFSYFSSNGGPRTFSRFSANVFLIVSFGHALPLFLPFTCTSITFQTKTTRPINRIF